MNNAEVQDEWVVVDEEGHTYMPSTLRFGATIAFETKQVMGFLKSVMDKVLVKTTSGVSEMLNKIPDAIHANTVDLSMSIAERLHKYGNVIRGTGDDSLTKESASIRSATFDYLQNLRQNDKERYNTLANFAASARNEKNEMAKMASAIVFFNAFVAPQIPGTNASAGGI